MKFIFIFLGAGLGGMLRYAIAAPINKNHILFPLGTITVNLIGCFVAGALLAFSLKKSVGPPFLLFFLPGFLGGFTTFSSFSMETIVLLQGGHSWIALWNIVVSLSGILATGVGFVLGHRW